MIRKRTLLIFFILSVGCTKRKDDNIANKTNGNIIKKTLAEKMDGYWLSDNYLINISNSHSIYDSRAYMTKFWGFRLEKKNLLSNSPMINGFTEHEGGYDAPVKFDSIKNCFINNLVNVDEFSFIKKPFTLTLVDPKHLELDFGDEKDIYRKVEDAQVELRKILFEGQFRDLLHDNRTIEFTRDGVVKGLEGRKYFELVFDFGEGINYDVSIFYPDKDSAGLWTKGDLFHFKFESDTLKLYKITSDWHDVYYTIGDLEYLLVKL